LAAERLTSAYRRAALRIRHSASPNVILARPTRNACPLTRQLMSKLLMGGVNVEGVVRRTLTLVQLFLDLHHIRRPLRAYRTRVDDRVPIDIVDTGHDALLEFLLGSHPDVTQDRARSLDTNEESTNKSTVP